MLSHTSHSFIKFVFPQKLILNLYQNGITAFKFNLVTHKYVCECVNVCICVQARVSENDLEFNSKHVLKGYRHHHQRLY